MITLAKSVEVDKAVDQILKSLGLVSTEEALGKAVDSLTETENDEAIKILSDISVPEASRYALLLTIAKRYKLNWLRDYVIELLKLRCSVNRLGRREIVRMVSGMEVREHAGLRAWLARKFGRGKKEKESAMGYAPF